jgi:hypothetical protein
MDGTMCSGEDKEGFVCPYRLRCYRYMAPASDHWQSYFTEFPFDKEGECCEQFSIR